MRQPVADQRKFICIKVMKGYKLCEFYDLHVNLLNGQEFIRNYWPT